MPHASHNFTEPTAAEPLAGGCTGCGALPGDTEAATPCERPRAFKAAPRLVILESPYAAPTDAGRKLHVAYARAAMRDCLLKNEAPFASHTIYTQPGVLRDSDPIEREMGIDAGLAWGRFASATVVYDDLGVSSGMATGMRRARSEGRPVEHRQIPGWQPFAALPTEPRDKIIGNPRDFATWMRLAADAERLCGRDVAGRVLCEMLAASPAHARNVAAAMGIAAQSKEATTPMLSDVYHCAVTVCKGHNEFTTTAGASFSCAPCPWCGTERVIVALTAADRAKCARILDAATKAIACGRAGIYENEAHLAAGGRVQDVGRLIAAMLAYSTLVVPRRCRGNRHAYAPGKPVAAPTPAAAPPQATTLASATKATPSTTVAGWYDWPSNGGSAAAGMEEAGAAILHCDPITIDGKRMHVLRVAAALRNGKVRVLAVPWVKLAPADASMTPASSTLPAPPPKPPRTGWYEWPNDGDRDTKLKEAFETLHKGWVVVINGRRMVVLQVAHRSRSGKVRVRCRPAAEKPTKGKAAS